MRVLPERLHVPKKISSERTLGAVIMLAMVMLVMIT